ncbi:MAG: transglycosylase domain-containing protein [Bacteroidia bacterium]|nr:transglycosylase domain-containing protein [Bacteroidia bacterium]
MKNRSHQFTKQIRVFWLLFVLFIIVLYLFFLLISHGLFGEMPSFAELENPKSNLATEVYGSDQVLLGKFYFQNRTFVEFEDLSPNLVNALLATEDIRFYKHSGIDLKALIRVGKGIFFGGSEGGGSTITQQLAKNLFPRDTTAHFRLFRPFTTGLAKFKEWITAVRLERNYTKEEILVMYLNTVPFGSLTFGVKSACSTFFNTSPDSLNIEQAAMMIGVLKAPTMFSPVRNPERARKRRNVVLYQMERYDFITKHEYDSLSALPIKLNYKPQSHNEGLATYFREYLRGILVSKKPEKTAYWSNEKFQEDSLEWETNPLFGWCNKNHKPDGSNYNIYKDGLKIYTTINSRMQQYAEEAVTEHIGGYLQNAFDKEVKKHKKAPFPDDLPNSEIEKIINQGMKRSERYHNLKKAGFGDDEITKIFKTPVEMSIFSWKGDRDTIMTPYDSVRYYMHYLHAGFISIEPQTGAVRAYVGGTNYHHFKYDHVKEGKRQVGSTIKPFLYTVAMQEGYSPCYEVPNVPTTFNLPDGTTWTPKNSGSTDFDGKMVTLKWGLANSVNYISAWLMSQFKPQPIVNIMKKMGVKSKIDPVPSLILGTSDITLYEMAAAYCTFANKGVYTEPVLVTRIEDRYGNVLSTFKPNRTEAISEETAYLMLNLLQGVVNNGTASRLRFRYNFRNELGGKTGTTDNHSDGWFIGIAPNLVSGGWVGGDVRSIHFGGIAMGQGATMALPIFGLYMQKVYADSVKLGITKEGFQRPLHKLTIETDCDKYHKTHPDHKESATGNEEEELFK